MDLAARQLTTLVLSDNGLDNDSVIMLVDLLRMRPNITHLDLSSNPIETHSADALAAFLKECDSLHTLHLEGGASLSRHPSHEHSMPPNDCDC